MPTSIKFRTVHPFPARMAPSIALDELSRVRANGLRILDPMAGSGTTLVAARSRGHVAIGFDTDPLALLISQVWAARVPANTVLTHAVAVMAAASSRWLEVPASVAHPPGSDEETRAFARFLSYLMNLRQLRALSEAIGCLDHGSTRRVVM